MSGHGRSGTLADQAALVVSVPLTLKRRGGRKEVIAPEGGTLTTPVRPRTNASLALTLARAHRWRDLLEAGRFASIRGLALELGVDSSYVARLLRLTLAAPDFVEAILDGTEPSGLSLEVLYRAPADWEEQREALTACSHPY
jgi:hypothetical protein